MSLELILEKITGDARREAGVLLEEARREAAERVESWRRKAEGEAGSILSAAGAEAERLKRRAGAEARLESSKSLLARKRGWLARVREVARERLMADARLYGKILESLLGRHLDAQVTGAVLSSDPVAARLASSLGTGPGVSVSTAAPGEDPVGGVILRKGAVTLNLSLGALLDELGSARQVELQKMLFGGPGE